MFYVYKIEMPEQRVLWLSDALEWMSGVRAAKAFDEKAADAAIKKHGGRNKWQAVEARKLFDSTHCENGWVKLPIKCWSECEELRPNKNKVITFCVAVETWKSLGWGI